MTDAAALLERQHLDGQFPHDATALVEALAGLNAQTPRSPNVAAWARGGPALSVSMSEALGDYRVVRANLMRGTVHAVTPRQYAAWWPALRPALRRVVNSFSGGFAAQVDAVTLAATALEVLREHGPLSRLELGERLVPRFPGVEASKLGFASRLLAPIVQAAGSVSWTSNRPVYVPFEDVCDVPLGEAADTGLADLARSYAGAFAASDPADFAYWSGVTVREARGVADTLHDGAAAEGQRRSARGAYVLPEFDNVFFARKSSIPFAPADAKKRLIFGAAEMKGCLIEDGHVVAEWRRDARTRLPALTPWHEGGGLSEPVRSEWESFTAWYAEQT